ncbi:MAG TPA: undecaprenyl-phosphate glucose phosphotransferase [Burkholderiales bacterium]|nr:undecaprenyl-phosphate glucose phosphotransferase [Burkholderiales bacterium]
MSVARAPLLNVVELVFEPLVLVASLWALAFELEGALRPQYMILALVVFALSFPNQARLAYPRGRAVLDIVTGWLATACLLVAFGHVSGYLDYFDRHVLLTWAWVAPWCQLGGHFTMRLALPWLRALQGAPKRALFAGMNAHGIELARRLQHDAYCNVRVVGFVDDRLGERVDEGVPSQHEYRVLGRLEELPELVQRHEIELVYLALPMCSTPRLRVVLDALRDTTASVYFVPDPFVTDLIQGSVSSVSGMPLLGVCDTPFSGASGLLKRTADIVLAALILVAIAPLFAAIALAVKASSPGPVIFRQRRYGLDGEEIIVYKFRSMRVTEDGAVIRQATRADERITPVGAFLRRTSLDELPQFLNVLQGRMSIVGPRPHAVAHNELYRKLIKGYMQRHKVKPGITGWAQVNGLRGETATLERMRSRIEHDLDYLRNWSLRLDLYIIAKTVGIVLGGRNAH